MDAFSARHTDRTKCSDLAIKHRTCETILIDVARTSFARSEPNSMSENWSLTLDQVLMTRTHLTLINSLNLMERDSVCGEFYHCSI